MAVWKWFQNAFRNTLDRRRVEIDLDEEVRSYVDLAASGEDSVRRVTRACAKVGSDGAREHGISEGTGPRDKRRVGAKSFVAKSDRNPMGHSRKVVKATAVSSTKPERRPSSGSSRRSCRAYPPCHRNGSPPTSSFSSRGARGPAWPWAGTSHRALVSPALLPA